MLVPAYWDVSRTAAATVHSVFQYDVVAEHLSVLPRRRHDDSRAGTAYNSLALRGSLATCFTTQYLEERFRHFMVLSFPIPVEILVAR